MSAERKAQLRIGRLRSEAKVREAKQFLLEDRAEAITSRLPQHLRTNQMIKKLQGFVVSERIKWKINEDGSPMAIDDEIDYRRRNGLNLLKEHLIHLGLPVPEKGAAKAEAGEPITAEELERMRQYLTAEEYEALAASAEAA
jgi:hypothetical protein